MIRILEANSAPAALLIQFREWLEAEWGTIDPFEGNHSDVLVPAPLVAVDDKLALLGGLAFSSFPGPQNADIAVWINAVFVSPPHQKQGIASQLVESAAVAAKRNAVPELFVLSEFPALYQKLGWQIVGLDSARNETILTKMLVGAALDPNHANID